MPEFSIELIARLLRVSDHEATAALEQFAQTVRREIERNDVAFCPGLGAFRTHMGTIVFEPDHALADRVNRRYAGLDTLVVTGESYTPQAEPGESDANAAERQAPPDPSPAPDPAGDTSKSRDRDTVSPEAPHGAEYTAAEQADNFENEEEDAGVVDFGGSADFTDFKTNEDLEQGRRSNLSAGVDEPETVEERPAAWAQEPFQEDDTDWQRQEEPEEDLSGSQERESEETPPLSDDFFDPFPEGLPPPEEDDERAITAMGAAAVFLDPEDADDLPTPEESLPEPDAAPYSVEAEDLAELPPPAHREWDEGVDPLPTVEAEPEPEPVREARPVAEPLEAGPFVPPAVETPVEPAVMQEPAARGRRGWWALAALAVVALLAFFLLNRPERRPDVAVVTPTEETPPAAAPVDSQSTQPDEATPSEPVVEAPASPTTESMPETLDGTADPLRRPGGIRAAAGGYTLVVASVVDRAAAEREAQKMRNQGLTAAVLHGQFQGKTSYRVSVGQFESIRQADASIADLPAGTPQPWIMPVLTDFDVIQ